MGPESLTQRFASDPLTGFGSRAALVAHLERAVDPASTPSVLAIFALGGLDEFERAHGAAEADEVIARLAEELAQVVHGAALCYVPRRQELCALFEMPLAAASPTIAAAAIALRREGAISLITTAFGIAVLPDDASEPIGALIVADRRLVQARKAQRKNRAVLG